ncbi:uncharacterized protein [Nicotiana tomentosiformis]|uniref:uncharacterized protein n=1 Tax=Nicotiana tomentosiformis TaxID=4098 RepID=UPI00388CADB3
MGSLAVIPPEERPLDMDVQALDNRLVRLDIPEPSRVLAYIVVQSSLFECFKAHQYDDPHLLVLKNTVHRGGDKKSIIGKDDVIQIEGRLCVPNVDGLSKLILQEAHCSWYSIHPGATKISHDLKQHYWWQRMKKDIVGHVFVMFELAIS